MHVTKRVRCPHGISSYGNSIRTVGVCLDKLYNFFKSLPESKVALAQTSENTVFIEFYATFGSIFSPPSLQSLNSKLLIK